MIFPTLSGHRGGVMRFNHEAKLWLEKKGFSPEENPLKRAKVCQIMVDEFHQSNRFSFSYTGWFERRCDVLRGTYLDAPFDAVDKKFIHLGVDCNAPAHTPVSIDHPGEVLRIDDDHPEPWGWGPRVFVQLLDNPNQDIVLIFAHLANISCRVGDVLQIGDQFATIGSSTRNGGWFTHVHVQAMRLDAYEWYLYRDALLGCLDGYCSDREMNTYQRPGAGVGTFRIFEDFPNPLKYVDVGGRVTVPIT